jgi:tRNA(Ile)-lysidine synthase
MIVAPPDDPDSAEWEEVRLPVPGAADLKELEGRIESALLYPHDVSCVKLSDDCRAYIDGEAVGILSVRPPRAGDAFRPLGSRGSKKLYAFLIDRKVPRHQRIRTPIVVSNDAIVWVAGHRIDERFKITKNSRRVIALKWIRSG